MVVSPRALDRLPRRHGRRQRRVLHPALLRRVAPLARRGDVHPLGHRRRRLRPDHPGRLDGDGRLVAPARPSSRSSTRRAASARRRSPRTSPSPSSSTGPEGPARRRRHGDRPRHDVARHRARPDRRRQLARRGRRRLAETLIDLATPHPSGMRSSSLTTSPLNTEILEPSRVADAITASPPRLRLHRRRPAPVATSPSTGRSSRRPTGSSSRSRRTCPPCGPPSSCATSPSSSGIRDRLALVVNRANSGVSVADMERTVGHAGPRPDPVRRPALRPRRERGPDGHRDVSRRSGSPRTSTPSPIASSGRHAEVRSPRSPARRPAGSASSAARRKPPGPDAVAPDRSLSGQPSRQRRRQLREAVRPSAPPRADRRRRLDPGPRTAPDEDRQHPGRGRGPDVVVDAGRRRRRSPPAAGRAPRRSARRTRGSGFWTPHALRRSRRDRAAGRVRRALPRRAPAGCRRRRSGSRRRGASRRHGDRVRVEVVGE